MATICPEDPMGENVQYNKNVSIVIIFFSPPPNHLLGKLIIKEFFFFFSPIPLEKERILIAKCIKLYFNSLCGNKSAHFVVRQVDVDGHLLMDTKANKT